MRDTKRKNSVRRFVPDNIFWYKHCLYKQVKCILSLWEVHLLQIVKENCSGKCTCLNLNSQNDSLRQGFLHDNEQGDLLIDQRRRIERLFQNTVACSAGVFWASECTCSRIECLDHCVRLLNRPPSLIPILDVLRARHQNYLHYKAKITVRVTIVFQINNLVSLKWTCYKQQA